MRRDVAVNAFRLPQFLARVGVESHQAVLDADDDLGLFCRGCSEKRIMRESKPRQKVKCEKIRL